MKWTGAIALLVVCSMAISALSFLVSVQYTGTGDGEMRGVCSASFLPSVTVYSSTNVMYMDGDLAKGANNLYAYSDQYSDAGSVYVKRSTDGSTWLSTNVLSGLYYPHGGFCVYTVGSTDHVIVSSLGNVRKSIDNGCTFSSLSSLGISLDYTAVATNASMDPSRPYDGDIYIAGNEKGQTSGIYLIKSTDGGLSWSPLYYLAYDYSYLPVLTRSDTKLYCFYRYDSGASLYDIYVKESTDWGKTWGSAVKIYSKTQITSTPCHAQYIDESRCLLTISDVGTPPYSNSRGVYGYFWFSNSTFQQIGNETGSTYATPETHTYTGIAFNDQTGLNYTSLWCYYIDNSNYEIKVHISYDTGLTIPPPPNPRIVNFPDTEVTVYRNYSFNASSTAPDNGSTNWWDLSTNAGWLSIAWSNNTNCLLTGIPTAAGSYWASLKVSDSDSSDWYNWTINIIIWSPAASAYSINGLRCIDGDIAKGANYLYAFANEYDASSSAYVKRSTDGSTWSNGTTVWSGLNYPHGGFCAFNVSGKDYLIASAIGNVKMSTDNGSTFSSLASLGSALDYTTVATNASMNPSRSYDDNIYIAGNIGVNGVYLKKSINDGTSWSTSYTIIGSTAICPTLMRDSAKLYCVYTLCTDAPTYSMFNEIHVRNSTDWGKTWGAAKKIYTAINFGSAANHAQYIDEQRCLLTISDEAASGYANSRGVYGYLWFGNNTFQQIGYETGLAYNNPDGHTYAGITSNGIYGINYTSLWCYYVNSNNYEIKTHYSYSTKLLKNPIILNNPAMNSYVLNEYIFNASSTHPDSGASTWNLTTNASWLSIEWNNETNCLVTGTPIAPGSYWVLLKVSDLDSSDCLNWIITVSVAPTPPLEEPAIISLAPPVIADYGEYYSYMLNATGPDNGSSVWSISTNSDWLSIEWSTETDCVVGGVPMSLTSCWVNITVSDGDSSDYLNWTINVNPPVFDGFTPHATIKIEGDSDFTFANGVVGGSGTRSDPYIIEGWNISAYSSTGIYIGNTTAYFIVRDCFVHDGMVSYGGIVFNGVQNGLLTNNTCLWCLVGITLSTSDSNTVSDNICDFNYGIGIVVAYSSINNLITNNDCSGNIQSGIALLSECDGNVISGNNCSSSLLLDGIDIVMDCDDNVIYGNNCSSNFCFGISLIDSSDQNLIFDNCFQDNGLYGIAILSANVTGNRIMGNTFEGNHGSGTTYISSHAQAYDDGSNNWWNSSAGYGNYWRDLTTPDVAIQFGIVDVTYKISGDASAVDSYPLTLPYGSPDVYAPLTTSTITGTLGNCSWYNSSVTLTLCASDWLSGVNETCYRIGTSGAWLTYNQKIELLTEGNLTVQFYSRDNAGNNETVWSITVQIDTKSPTTSASVSGLELTLTATDNTSGISKTYYRIDNGTWTEYNGAILIANDGHRHSVDYCSIDVAGNNESVKTVQVGNASTSWTDDILLIAIIVAVVIAAILCALIIIRRLGGGKEPGTVVGTAANPNPPVQATQIPAPPAPVPLVTPQPQVTPPETFCQNCGSPVKNEWLFCRKCGKKIN
jgi:parallel beta-helix repeat protein